MADFIPFFALAVVMLAAGVCLPVVILWARRMPVVLASCAPEAQVFWLAKGGAGVGPPLDLGLGSSCSRAPPAIPASVSTPDIPRPVPALIVR